MVLREMVTTYGRSPGGYLWAILEPVAAIALLSVVFSLAFHAPALGSSFPLFFATAYLPIMLFLDVTNKVATSLRFSRPLLAYPAVTMIDVLAARFALNVSTHLLVFALVVGAIIGLGDVRGYVDPLTALNALAMAGALAFGFGCVNCYMFMAFPVYERLWSVATRPLVIVSGLFFLFEDVPGLYRDILWFNPLFHSTGAARDAFYATYDAAYVSPAFVYLLAGALAVLGLLLLSRSYRDLLDL